MDNNRYIDFEAYIEPDKSFLTLFFRNLILGEQNELKNRYMLIGYVGDTPTSTPTSTEQVQVGGNQFITEKENIKRLIVVVGEQKMSVKEMMEATGLKDRKNFLEYTLNPAINEGWVRMLYPDSPRHPRQKYLLTIKGKGLYSGLRERESKGTGISDSQA